MLLRKKISFALLILWLAIGFVIYFLSFNIIFKTFVRLEDDDQTKTADFLTSYMQNKIENQHRLAKDWGKWDDTRDFIINQNSKYIENNLTPQSLIVLNIDFIVFANLQGEIVFTYNGDSDYPDGLANELYKIKEIIFVKDDNSHETGGITEIKGTPTILTCAKVTNSDATKPANGTIIYGKFIDNKCINKLREELHLDLKYNSFNDIDEIIQKQLANQNNMILHISDIKSILYKVIYDLKNEPYIVFAVNLDRKITQNGKNTIYIFFIIISAVVMASLFCIYWFISKNITSRLNRICKEIEIIKQNNTISDIISIDNYKDEITYLTNELNNMLRTLADAKENLEEKIFERTYELRNTNALLNEEIEIRKRKEEELKLFKNIFTNTNDAIFITEPDETILCANPSFYLLSGFKPGEVIGFKPDIIKSTLHAPEFYKQLDNELFLKGQWSGELWCQSKEGNVFPVIMSISSIHNRAGELKYRIIIMHDISKLKENEAQLFFQAYYDALTGLPNRTLCYDRLDHAMKTARRSGAKVAVLYLDLDNFKNINDTLGHNAGDELLNKVAVKLQQSLRASDTISRIGGDEFIIIIEALNEPQAAATLAEKIIKEIKNPFNLNGTIVNTSTSIGITIYPDDATTIDDLIKYADMAMYQAKSKTKGSYQFYMPDMEESIKRLVQLEYDLKMAIENDEFVMHYQPVQDTNSGEVLFFEALVRWNRGGEIIYPSEFIDFIENSNLVHDFTRMILQKVCRCISALSQTGRQVNISVNISGNNLTDTDFDTFMDSLIEHFKIKPSQIILEITEYVLLNAPEIVKTLTNLSNKGFTICLDDFGTGYSSLTSLKEFPIKKIKIDRSFIKNIQNNQDDAAICEALVKLSRSLGMQIVAEGVETDHQRDILKTLGCFAHQGYFYSKPLERYKLNELFNDSGTI